MQHTRGLQARWAFVLIMASNVALPVIAAEPRDQALRLDHSIQQLKEEVLAFNRTAQAIENEVLLPAHARISVYLSTRVAGFLLEEVSVTINDGRPTVHHYDGTDARALLVPDAAQRLARLALPPGTHRVRASFRGHYADAPAGAAPLTGTLDAQFQKESAETELELVIERERRLGGAPRLAMTQWKPAP